MATKRKHKPCQLADEGCTAHSWKGGYCWKHHPENIANNKAACADKAEIRKIHKGEALVQVQQIVLCDECGNDPCLCVAALPESFGKVVNGNGDRVTFGVDEVIWFALEDALNAKKREWMVELSGLKPARAICRTAEILKAVEVWGV